MHSIIQLFIRHGGLLTLVVLEVVCFYLIASFNDPQRLISSVSWLKYSGQLLEWKTEGLDYLSLKEQNERLRNQIADLGTQLTNARLAGGTPPDTFAYAVKIDTLERQIARPEFTLIPAKVISNTISGSNNWLMINRGRRDGVQPNTGVITAGGLAGIVRYVSDDFAVAMSVLHRQTKISASLKNYEYFGSLIWEGDDPQYMTLTDIPSHISVQRGDTVQVSQFSLLFPAGHLAGRVDSAYLKPGSNFLSIVVKLSQTPAAFNNVYVVNNKFSDQIDQLQQAVKDE
jgi:rod shape-determining protein MreC